jgi:phosphoribosylglycinamide formyltransferase 1
MTQSTARLAVLISGNGSNLQAIIDACAGGNFPAQIAVVISNKADAIGLERARAAGITTVVKLRRKGQDRREYDAELADLVDGYQVDWVILAGWMLLLSAAFLNHFPGKVINLHPALPGTFPGTHAIERAFEAYQAGQIRQTGVMVHLVPDEGVDCGPVLAQEIVPIFSNDTVNSLEQRIHRVEHRMLVETIRQTILGSI